MHPTHSPIRIVIAGGGFAGINLIKKLAGDLRFHVTLVDTNNYHFFPPLLYQVSFAFIEPSNICYPFRRMFQEKQNLRFFWGTVTGVDPDAKKLLTSNGELPYDHLVLALGTESNFFGMENVRKHSMPMKSINDAILLRNHMLINLEQASRAKNPAEKERLLNIVIAGGGPTGVEVAGMLAEMNHHIAKKDYPEFTDVSMKIHLVDAGDVLLGPMSKRSQLEATSVLLKLGVNIRMKTLVKDFDGQLVTLSDGNHIAAASLIWASGVTVKKIPGLPDSVYGRGQRIRVDEFNRVLGFEAILALGDISFMEDDPAFPQGHPQLAQVAIQQGVLAARNFRNMATGVALQPFRYHDKGSMAIISKYKAVVDLPKGFIKGFIAWLLWLFIHIIPIAGFRNKVRLAFSWFWSFLTNDPTLRLIIRPNLREKNPHSSLENKL